MRRLLNTIKHTGGGRRLPTEYQEVEYIESDGTQWIDTGYTPNQNTISQIKISFKVFSGDVVYGYFIGSDRTDVRFFNGGGNCYWDIPNDKRREVRNVFSLNTIYELEFGNWYAKDLVSGIDIFNGTPNPSFTGTASLTLNHSSGQSANSSNIWYYVKIYDGATLVRDFVPCYRKADTEIGLYDLVEGVFYTNDGSGSFTKGPDVGGWQPNANTLLYLPFKEDLLDHSGNNVTMIQGGTNLSIVNGVAEFDGGYLYKGGLSSIQNFPLTISVWVNADTISSGENDIISSNVYSGGFYGWNNIIHNSKFRLECLPGGNQYSAATVSVNTRYNIVNVLENGSCKLYVNGSLEGTISGTPNLRDRLCIGATYWSSADLGTNPFDGKMSEVIIEDKARTAQEIEDYYNQTKALYGIS